MKKAFTKIVEDIGAHVKQLAFSERAMLLLVRRCALIFLLIIDLLAHVDLLCSRAGVAACVWVLGVWWWSSGCLGALGLGCLCFSSGVHCHPVSDH